MSKLSVERGFNGVAFVKVNDKPALSISSYGNRDMAMRILDMMVSAPELLETLAGMSAAVQKALDATQAEQAIDGDELRHWLERARAQLGEADIHG